MHKRKINEITWEEIEKIEDRMIEIDKLIESIENLEQKIS